MTTGFPALDQLSGGLTERKAYVLHGNAREAATALALSFLTQGVNNGRPVALVTERSADSLVQEASRYGLNLGERLDSGALLLFEYPANVSASSHKLADDSRIIREFQTLVGQHGIDRLVLDPVTPLLIAPNSQVAANRFQSMVSSFSGLGATTIYVLHGPGGAEYVPLCRDAAEGVLRLDTMGSGCGKIVFEQWPQDPSAQELEFGVVAGVGLVPVSRGAGLPNGGYPNVYQAVHPGVLPGVFPGMRSQSVYGAFQSERPERHERRSMISIPQISQHGSGLLDNYDKPRILVMHPDVAQRTTIAAMLRKNYAVDEAHGAVDGLASLGDSPPDILVLAQEMRGISGAAIVHKLRQSGHNLPVILVGSRIRRLSDQTSLLRSGVDICLEYPIHGQLLNLYIDNFLRRIGRLRDPLNREVDIIRKPQRQGVNCTTDLHLFCDRAAEEVSFSMEQGLPVPVFVMYYSSGKPLLEELSSAVLMVTRSTDLVYVGTRGIGILLPEARALEPFLARFSRSWTSTPPVIDQPRVTGHPDLREYLGEYIGGLTGSGFSVAPPIATERTRGIPMGAASNGSPV